MFGAIAAGLIQTVVLNLGLTGLSSNAAGAATEPPVTLVTNVVARRVVHDVIQTLLEVRPATDLSAPLNGSALPTQTAFPGSFQVVNAGSNTN